MSLTPTRKKEQKNKEEIHQSSGSKSSAHTSLP